MKQTIHRVLLISALLGLSLSVPGCAGSKNPACGQASLGSGTCSESGCLCHECDCDECDGDDCDPDRCRPWCSPSVADVQPLGAVVRSHYHTMQTNAEAADFVFYRNEFVGSTAELTPLGRDHLLEVAARMPSTPFPVLIERSEHNAQPELDAHRREMVVRLLARLGNPDAPERTFVAPAYGRAAPAIEVDPACVGAS